jgi:hypothetical protein
MLKKDERKKIMLNFKVLTTRCFPPQTTSVEVVSEKAELPSPNMSTVNGKLETYPGIKLEVEEQLRFGPKTWISASVSVSPTVINRYCKAAVK